MMGHPVDANHNEAQHKRADWRNEWSQVLQGEASTIRHMDVEYQQRDHDSKDSIAKRFHPRLIHLSPLTVVTLSLAVGSHESTTVNIAPYRVVMFSFARPLDSGTGLTRIAINGCTLTNRSTKDQVRVGLCDFINRLTCREIHRSRKSHELTRTTPR